MSFMIQPTTPNQPGVTVVVMAYDEVATLGEVVHEVDSALGELGPAMGEILIIDDGSTDGTAALADELAAGSGIIRTIHHPGNRGLGEVYRTGFTAARREFVTFFPADGQFPASLIPAFFGLIQEHDLVLGFITDRKDHLGKVLSWMQRALFRILVGPVPRFQGILMLRCSVLRGVPISSSGRAATMVYELILKIVRGGYRVTSVATEHRPRRSGHSKVNNWRTIRSNITAALGLRRAMTALPSLEQDRGDGPRQ